MLVKYQLDISKLEDIRESMYKYSAVTRRGASRDRSYAIKIAKWFNEAPGVICHSIYPHVYKGSHITTYHLPIKKMRNTLKLGRSDKGGWWFDFFKDNYPLYDVQRTGASYNDYKVCSEVIINNQYCLDKYKQLTHEQLDYSYLIGQRDKGNTSDVRVDMSSLTNYINNGTLTDIELRDANKILMFCKWLRINDNQQDAKYVRMPQNYNQGSNGRYFSRGEVSVVNCSSKVREAMLGPCYEVDLEAAVFGYYRTTIEELKGFEDGIDSTPIDDYLHDKQTIRETIAKDCNISIEQVKRGLTSMTFGAKIDNTEYSSLVTLIPNKVKKAKFVGHPIVRGLEDTINGINIAIRVRDTAIIADLMVNKPDKWVNVTKKGNKVFKINSYLSHLYTRYETKVMIGLIAHINKDNQTLLWVHDGLYCRNKPNEDSINEFLLQYNKWAKCSITEK
jgi:hypothetical protein